MLLLAALGLACWPWFRRWPDNGDMHALAHLHDRRPLVWVGLGSVVGAAEAVMGGELDNVCLLRAAPSERLAAAMEREDTTEKTAAKADATDAAASTIRHRVRGAVCGRGPRG